MSHPFEYRKPNDEQAEQMQRINEDFKSAYNYIVQYVDPSAERTIAIRKLQEARMWINVAILGIEI